MRWTRLAAVTATIAPLLGNCPSFGQEGRPIARADGLRTIEVVGEASTSLVPDIAAISVGSETRGATARAVLDENNKALASLMNVLKQRGVAGRDIQTSGLALNSPKGNTR